MSKISAFGKYHFIVGALFQFSSMDSNGKYFRNIFSL